MCSILPTGCFKKNCNHFKSWEEGIDDVYYYCDLLKRVYNIYDDIGFGYKCPLDITPAD